MHPVSVLTCTIFFAGDAAIFPRVLTFKAAIYQQPLTHGDTGYLTARGDLITRLASLALFAWEKDVLLRAAYGSLLLSVFFLLLLIPIDRIAAREAELVCILALPSKRRF